MSRGFDLSSSLVCEGIIGDGCGGGRIFYVDTEKLYVYDSVTKQSIKLLEGLVGIESISKKACIITLSFADEIRYFDLSSL